MSQLNQEEIKDWAEADFSELTKEITDKALSEKRVKCRSEIKCQKIATYRK